MVSIDVVINAVVEQLGPGDYEASNTLLECGADSLDFVEILMTIEDAIDISLNEDDFSMSMTLQQMAEVISL